MSADKHEINQAGPQRAGIWVRVSHELSVERESPEVHEARLRAFCLSKGCEVIEVYRLDAVSGRDVTNHPETLRMLADVRRGHINLLVFSKLARLARNTKHLLEFLDIFNEHGAALVSLGESLDTNTAAGKLFYTLVAAMAEWEREEIAARIREAVETRMGLGKCVSGSISLGYHWVDGLVEPKQDEIPAVQRCFQLHKELRHYKKVARRLDRENFRGKNNRRFNAGMVRRIINDPIYIGKYRRNHTFSKNGEKGKKPESEWIYLDVRPIISKELWDDCQSIVKERKPKTERGRAPKHLFAGLMWCTCGHKMYVPTLAQKQYDCRRSRMRRGCAHRR